MEYAQISLMDFVDIEIGYMKREHEIPIKLWISSRE